MPTLQLLTPKQIIAEIARLKRELDNDTTPLIDGSFPTPGPFDGEQDTVASATKPSQAFTVQQFLFAYALRLRPQKVLDIGTNVGISAAYLAAAMACAGSEGIVHTIDASPYKIRLAQRLHADLGLNNVDYTVGLFRDVLPEVLERMGGVDMALIDADHDLKGTWSLYEQIVEAATSGALLIFTDVVGRNEGVTAAWRRIQNDERTYAFAQLGTLGFVYKA